ncbi:hypothetical protein [Dactylosporangium sp. CA-092794]|uniref:hypothetical protein n=1 Tax=Dactylosporangium sp. CA-092794 TaxID=3239929 RepID=UPI003D8FA96F
MTHHSGRGRHQPGRHRAGPEHDPMHRGPSHRGRDERLYTVGLQVISALVEALMHHEDPITWMVALVRIGWSATWFFRRRR